VISYVFSNDLRYLFGLNILKQETPVMYSGSTTISFGSDGADFDSTKYIAETDPALPTPQMSLVNQYFGS